MNLSHPISNRYRFLIHNQYFINVSLILILTFLIWANFLWVSAAKYDLSTILKVLKNPAISALEGSIQVGISVDDFQIIAQHIWATLATIISGLGLALSGIVMQIMARNPLADASTFGFMQGGVLALVIALSIGISTFYLKFLFVLVGIGVVLVILFLVITFSSLEISQTKIVLIGLALGIVFKTFTYLIRTNDKYLSNVTFNYILGGAEVVNQVIGEGQWQTLYIGSALIGFSLILFLLLARSFTLLEVGDVFSSRLGNRVKMTKVGGLVILLLSIPTCVIMVGNLAFVGLFSVHLARYFVKKRNYYALLWPCLLIGGIISSFGIFMNMWIPSLNSGLWMTFIGAPYLIYAGVRGLK